MSLPATDWRSVAPNGAAAGAFVPRRWLRNGHAMTVFAWASRRRFAGLPPAEARLFQVAPDSQVLAHCYWQSDRTRRPTLLVLHGLEGSSEAHYMRGFADKAWRHGWNTVLLNQRNCGGTEHLTPHLYHSGLTGDPRTVIRTLAAEGIRDVLLVGYSLGGNLTLKLAGELGDSDDLPLVAVAAVSPTVDLSACVRAIERPPNIVYHWNFVRSLKMRMRRKAAAWPGRFDLAPLDSIRSIRRFDAVYTAPLHGFTDEEDYYHRASALRVAEGIRRPTLLLAAANDPFVPPVQFAAPGLADNPAVRLRVEPFGGHCGFVGRAVDGDDGFWAEATVIEFFAGLIGARDRGAPAPR